MLEPLPDVAGERRVFHGEVRFIRESAKARMASNQFTIEFTPEMDRIATFVEIGECRFPASGDYTFEVWFGDEDSLPVQKGEESSNSR